MTYDPRDPFGGPPPQTLNLDPELSLRPERSGRGVFFLAAALSLAALGLGAYAFQLLSERRKLQEDVAVLTTEKTEVEERVVTLVAEQKQTKGETQAIEARLAATEAELSQMKEARQEIEGRLAEYQRFRKKFQSMIDSGQLDITFRRGRMIVEMPAQVLFDSGSAELSEAGQQAVLSVAKILRKVAKHRFLVGGHTDNVPAVKEYKSNWALSAARAVGVTEALIRHGVAQRRLVVAGYSEFDPVATNRSEAGRQKNRRIEIVLEPYVEQKMAEQLLEASGG